MPDPRTQKQVAEKYKGNLNYFTKPHLLRTARFLTSFLAIVIGISGIIWFYNYGSDRFYNPGPVSQTHANLEGDCASCHPRSQRQRFHLLSPVGSRSSVSETTRHGASTSVVSTLFDRLVHGVSFSEIDHSCLRCHISHDLHQPDLQTVALKEFRKEIHVVHAESCSSCHREHVGTAVMKLPSSAECIACHGDAARMANALERLPIAGKQASNGAVVSKLQDGLVHFIPPQPSAVGRDIFTNFADKHPDFEYEAKGLRDPNVLRFNHRLHLGQTVGKIGGQSLNCTFCHKPAPEGRFYQRVSFDNSCLPCHSLQFDPENPEMKLPHGDPDKVRAFLRSLPFQYTQLAAQKSKTKADADAYVARQMARLKERIRNGEDFERQIFYTSNPYKAAGMPDQASFPGCAYCHEVKADSKGAPVITRPTIADRWLNHGRFTHVKHTHIDCRECHDAAQSKDTADILMPSKASCAECHRPPTHLAKGEVIERISLNPDATLNSRQRQEGGIASECITCHTFHASPTVKDELGMLHGITKAK